MNIKYILTHPIQYQSPLIRYLTKKGIDIEVLYRSNYSTKKFFDKQFKREIKWDINLLKGYKYRFLDYIGPNRVSLFFPITIEYYKKIFSDKANIIWVHSLKNWYNLIIIVLSKIHNKKVFIRDESHFLIRGTHKKRGFFNHLFNKSLFFFLDPLISGYLCIGSANKNFYKRYKIEKKKLFHVPYTVDNNFFYKKKIKKTNNEINYLYAGKFTFSKGADLLIEAIKILSKHKNFVKKTKFTFIGDGEIKKECIEYVKKNKLVNVKFLPFQNKYNDLIKYYQKCDVFILPSRFETWGLTINEAMSCRSAIISSKECGASYDLVKNDINGHTFKNNDAIDLSKKILKIYKQKKKINLFKNNSFKIISKWSFAQCYDGLKKAIDKQL